MSTFESFSREEQRSSAADLIDVELRTPGQYNVKIGDVGTIDMSRGYQRLYHYDAQRAVVVYADVDNRLATSVSANESLRARFSDTAQQNPGMNLVFGGEYQETNQAFADMGRALIVALIAIYTILAAQFRSYIQPLVVMCVIVFAYIGVILGMYLWGYSALDVCPLRPRRPGGNRRQRFPGADRFRQQGTRARHACP